MRFDRMLDTRSIIRLVSGGLLLLLATLLVAPAAAQVPTAFTYQAQLQQSGSPVDGTKDLQFTLYDSKTGGSTVGSAVVKQDVTVSNGVLTTSLDFGAAFAGGPRFIEVGVRDGGSAGSFTTLSPRTALRPAPLAMALPNVTVDTDGKVGVATASPASPLTVKGTIESTSGGVKLPDGTVIQNKNDLGGGGGLPTTGSGAFDLSNDEGLVAPGTFGTGSIPATGAGTRMMWYPAKAAVRAGRVGASKDGTQWDASKVGDYSVAFGVDTKAKGFAATAIGDKTTAGAPGATAMGTSTTAIGNVSTAMGVLTTASDQAATAMGRSTTASSRYATAMGLETTAASNQSLSIGAYNSANTSADNTLFVAGNGSDNNSRSDALVLDKDGGLVLPGTFGTGSIPASGSGTRMMWYPAKGAVRAGRVGFNKDGTQWDDSKVGNYSVAFGLDTKANGDASTALGSGTTASVLAATAMGSLTTASSFSATAMGTSTTASGDQATAMGFVTTAGEKNATAMGNRTTASGENATAMGNRTTASGANATAMGSVTTAATNESLSIGEHNSANRSDDNTLFVAGNGDDSNFPSSRSNALVLKKDGNLTISGSLTQNSDRRLKTAVEPLGKDVLQKLGQIRPVRYRFKNERTHPSGEQIGLIAQEVRKEFPELISEGSEGYLSLAYPKLSAVLLKGLQEQQRQIEEKQQQIDALKRRVHQIENVKQRLATLEAERAESALAGLPGWGTGLLLAVLLGGLFGAGLVRYRRSSAAG